MASENRVATVRKSQSSIGPFAEYRGVLNPPDRCPNPFVLHGYSLRVAMNNVANGQVNISGEESS